MKPTQVIANMLWMYGGALIAIYMAKLGMTNLDTQTNVIMPTLIFGILGALYMLFGSMGY